MSVDNPTPPQQPDPLSPAPFQPAAFEPAPVQAARPKGRSASALNIALGLAVLVAIAGVAFAVGRGTAPVAAASGQGRAGFGQGGNFPGGGNGGNGNGGNGGGRAGGFGAGTGLEISGKVTAVGADSLTIVTSSGATVTVSTVPATTYHQQASGSASDVATGKSVIVSVDGLGSRGGGGGGAAASPNAQASPRTGLTPTATDITVVP